jgi:hypothetical protein
MNLKEWSASNMDAVSNYSSLQTHSSKKLNQDNTNQDLREVQDKVRTIQASSTLYKKKGQNDNILVRYMSPSPVSKMSSTSRINYVRNQFSKKRNSNFPTKFGFGGHDSGLVGDHDDDRPT